MWPNPYILLSQESLNHQVKIRVKSVSGSSLQCSKQPFFFSLQSYADYSLIQAPLLLVCQRPMRKKWAVPLPRIDCLKLFTRNLHCPCFRLQDPSKLNHLHPHLPRWPYLPITKCSRYSLEVQASTLKLSFDNALQSYYSNIEK